MKFRDAIRTLLSDKPAGLTPQELRDLIKANFPELYGTESHRRNVEKGHYKDLDHALLAQIYVVQRNASDLYSDRSEKPMRLRLVGDYGPMLEAEEEVEDTIAAENLEKLEKGQGTLYILGTQLFTKDGKEIVKIGVTTGPVEARVNHLYNTSVPYRFRIIQEIETEYCCELEQALHKFFGPFRINKSREFFTEDCLEFVDALVEMHKKISSASSA